MLKVITVILIWPIACLLATMVINTLRAKSGANVNDAATAFMQGFMFGPIGILAALNPAAQIEGKAGPLAFGGIAGTVVVVVILLSL